MSLEQAVERINDGIVLSRRQGLGKLLVDTRGLYGFERPGILARLWYGQKWAVTARGVVRFANSRPTRNDRF
jgi:hypothetical protein